MVMFAICQSCWERTLDPHLSEDGTKTLCKNCRLAELGVIVPNCCIDCVHAQRFTDDNPFLYFCGKTSGRVIDLWIKKSKRAPWCPLELLVK